jgi:transcriptional repressor NrdR
MRNATASSMWRVLCPSCQSPTRVLESRRAPDGAAVRRRRQCAGCGRRFTTFERREPEPVDVIKRDGERQRFDRTKLRAALLKAAHKRPVIASDIEAIVDRIELAGGEGGELSSERIGELCLAELRGLDWGAYLQFAGTLPSVSAESAQSEAAPIPAGSVRATREDLESTQKAASGRRLDG